MIYELWESIEWIVYLASAVGAIFVGVVAVLQNKQDADRLKALEEWRNGQDRVTDALAYRLEHAEGQVSDLEDRVRGLEKRRKAAPK